MRKFLPYVLVVLTILVLGLLAVRYFDQASAEQPIETAEILPVEPAAAAVETVAEPEQEDVIVAGAELFPTKIMVQVCGPLMDVWANTGWKFGADEVDVSQPLPEKNTFYPAPNISCEPDGEGLVAMGLVAEGAPGSQVPTGGAAHITVIVFDGDEITYVNYP